MAITVKEIVASNLRAARDLRGWNQAETVEKINEQLGAKWSVPKLSAAEHGRRAFDVEELFAFSRAFRLPIGWFLLPPEGVLQVETERGGEPATRDDLLNVVFPGGEEEEFWGRVGKIDSPIIKKRVAAARGVQEDVEKVLEHVAQLQERLEDAQVFARELSQKVDDLEAEVKRGEGENQ